MVAGKVMGDRPVSDCELWNSGPAHGSIGNNRFLWYAVCRYGSEGKPRQIALGAQCLQVRRLGRLGYGSLTPAGVSLGAAIRTGRWATGTLEHPPDICTLFYTALCCCRAPALDNSNSFVLPEEPQFIRCHLWKLMDTHVSVL